MPITNDGRVITLQAVKTSGTRARLTGQSLSGDPLNPTFTAWESDDLETVTWDATVTAPTLGLDSPISFDVNLPGGSFLVRVEGAKITNTAGTTTYFAKDFTSSFDYNLDGTFTLTQYDITVD